MNAIFRKLIGVGEDILEEYFQNKYDITTIVGSLEEKKRLPLSKKMAQELRRHIDEKTKKLDLDILFLASFHDMSNECIDHFHTHDITTENIVENYKKLTKNPLVTEM